MILSIMHYFPSVLSLPLMIIKVCYLLRGGILVNHKKTIIDIIAETLNLNYISDMRSEVYKSEIYSYIKKIDRQEYSIQEWAMLYQYISSNTLVDDELNNAYDRLLQYLNT